MKADEIAAQRIAENAQKQTVQHTRQRYAAEVTDTYIGGTLEDLRNVEPLGNVSTKIEGHNITGQPRTLTESAEGWWKSLKTSVEKNPTKWGLGAAAVALGLWVLSSSDKKQNV